MHGAEAIVVPCTYFNLPAVAKQRMPKTYRVHQLDFKLRRERTKLEARIMHKAKFNGVLCPLVLNVDIDKCEIVQTKLSGVKLVDFLERHSGVKQLREAGVQLARLHGAGISHGDSTTSNFIVDRSQVYIFDFGLSQFNPSLEDKAIDLLLFSKSVSAPQFKIFLKGYDAEAGHARTQVLIGQMRDILSRARYVER